MPESILIVEDDENLALLIEHSLRSKGYETTVATDGVQAMMLANKLKPSVILLDYMFPAGGGAGFHKRIRLSTHLRHTPILFLSAVDEKRVMESVDFDPATYYLGKPYQRKYLEDLVGRILEEHPSGRK